MSKLKNVRSRVLRQSKHEALGGAVRFALEALESRQLLSASIAGTLYNDVNGNHLRDVAESGVAGASVYLDLQGIETLTAADPVAITDAQGNYSFTGLTGGNYLVRVVPAAGRVTSTPIWGGKYFVQLAANQTVVGRDFGLQTASSPNFTVNGQLLIAGVANGRAILSRYNADGTTDVGFGPLGIITLPATVTGQPTSAIAQGSDTFIAYPSGSVTISPSGAITIGSVFINAPTTLVANATSPTTVQIGFTDNSNDDAGFTIERSISSTGPFLSVGSTTSVTGPGTGAVSFTDGSAQPNTTYYYRVYAVNGSVTSPVTGPVSVTTPSAVVAGPGVGGVVYNDLNGNHFRDAGETPVIGAKVYLDLTGIDSYVVGDPVVTTDATGHYNFSGLPAGNYLVRMVPQPGRGVTSPLWGGKYYLQLAAGQNSTGNDFGITPASTPAFRVAYDKFLIAGTLNGRAILTRYSPDGSTDLAFGSLGVVTLPAAITGQPNGVTIQGLNAVVSYAGAVVSMDDAGGILSITSTSQLNAPTNLTALATGPTSVQIDFVDNSTNEQALLIERAISTAGPWSTVGAFPSVTYGPTTGPITFVDNSVAQGTTYYYRGYAVNGLQQSAVAGPVSVTTPIIAIAGSASISGSVFEDRNLNGVKDAYEQAMPRVQLYLDLQGINQYVAGDPLATTDSAGNYSFTDLAAGNYLVRLKLFSGELTTSPLWGGKYFVQLTNHQAVTGQDFGEGSLSYTWPSATQNDGKLLVAAVTIDPATQRSRAAIRRFNVDSSVDTTFGTRGVVTINTTTTVPTPASATTFVMARNDGFIVAGTAVFSDYNSDGTSYEYMNLIDPFGKTVRSDFFGSNIFGTGGIHLTTASLLSSGSIVAIGYHSANNDPSTAKTLVLKRYSGDLTPNITFGNNGLDVLDNLVGEIPVVSSLPDGGLQLGFSSDSVKLSSSGAIDPTRLLAAPTGLSAVGPNPVALQLQFNDNSSNEQSFVIESAIAGSFLDSWQNIATLPGSTGTGLRTSPIAASPTTYKYRVRAVSGAVMSDVTAPLTVPGAVNVITGHVFDDANQNGYFDTGDTGTPNVHVYDPNNPAISTYTDANGAYTIYNATGKLRIGALDAGRIFTSPVSGSYDFSLPSTPSVVVLGGGTSTRYQTADFATAIPTTIPHVTLPDGQFIVATVVPSYFGGFGPNVPAAVHITRYNLDGTADTTYGVNGTATIVDPGFAFKARAVSMALALDGSVGILTYGADSPPFQTPASLGNSILSVVNASGQVVRSLSSMYRRAFLNAPLMTFAPDGKLILAGNDAFSSLDATSLPSPLFLLVERFNVDLTPDATFGNLCEAFLSNVNGVPTAVLGNSDGTIHISYANDAINITTNGNLDPSRILPVPTSITATAKSPTQVVVQFMDSGMTGYSYTIESTTRSSSGFGGTWVIEGTVPASGSTGLRQFLVNDAKPGVYALYRVRAFRGAVQSDPSATANATTPIA
jgi:uncharacterized delta-60 repeat protein